MITEAAFIGVFTAMGLLLGLQASHHYQHQLSKDRSSRPKLSAYLRYILTISAMIFLAGVAGRIDKDSEIGNPIVVAALVSAALAVYLAVKIGNRLARTGSEK